MRNRLSALIAAWVILSLLVAGCGARPSSPAPAENPAAKPQTAAATRDELKIRVWDDIGEMLPGLLNGSVETAIAYNVYSNLIKFRPGTTELVPDLAREWETSPDGLAYTFHLHQGVKWHKGFGELTSQDVKRSFEWIMNKDNGSPFAGDFANVSAIETPDNDTVIIRMKEPQPSFPAAVLAYRPGMIFKIEALEKYGDQYNSNVVGTGPYIFETWVPGERIVLKANPDYYGAKPKLNTVTFLVIKEESTFEAALENGDVDMGYTEDGIVGARLAENPKLKADVIAGPRTWYLQFNLKRKPFDDVRVRQAIWWALNKDELVQGAFNGNALATDTLLNTWTFGRLEEQPYHQDLNKARELLQQAGVGAGFKAVLHTYPTNAAPEMAAVIQEQLSKVGISLDIQVVEWSNLTTLRKSGDFDITLQPHLRLEPDQYFSQLLHSKSIPYPNTGGYQGMDDLIDQARSELNDDKRAELYHQIQRQVFQDAPVIPLVHPSFVLAYQPHVGGAIPANLTYNLPDIYIQE